MKQNGGSEKEEYESNFIYGDYKSDEILKVITATIHINCTHPLALAEPSGPLLLVELQCKIKNQKN